MAYLIYILIAYLPWQLALNPVEGVDLASIRILIILIFLVWFVRGLIKKSIKIALSPITLGLLFWLFLAGLSIFFAQETVWALRKFIYLASIFPLYFLISSSSNKIKPDKIIKILIGTAVVVAIFALIQFGLQFVIKQGPLIDFWAAKIGPLFYGKSFGALVAQNPSWLVELSGRPILRALATFPDSHMLSFFLGMILPFSLVGLLRPPRRKSVINLLAPFVLLGALLLTFSRGGYLGLIVSCSLVLIYLWSFLSIRQKKRLLFFGFLMILALLILARPIVARFSSIFDWQEGSNLGRMQIWQRSFKLWQSHPLFGVGLGNYPAEIDWSAPYRSAVTSHNLYLDILVELGIFALLTWLVLIFGMIFWLRQAAAWLRRKSKEAISPQRRMLMIGLMGSLTYFSVHSFFETAIFNPVILSLLMIILGLVARSKISK